MVFNSKQALSLSPCRFRTLQLIAFLMNMGLQGRSISRSRFVIPLATVWQTRRFCNSFWSRLDTHKTIFLKFCDTIVYYNDRQIICRNKGLYLLWQNVTQPFFLNKRIKHRRFWQWFLCYFLFPLVLLMKESRRLAPPTSQKCVYSPVTCVKTSSNISKKMPSYVSMSFALLSKVFVLNVLR